MIAKRPAFWRMSTNMMRSKLLAQRTARGFHKFAFFERQRLAPDHPAHGRPGERCDDEDGNREARADDGHQGYGEQEQREGQHDVHQPSQQRGGGYGRRNSPRRCRLPPRVPRRDQSQPRRP